MNTEQKSTGSSSTMPGVLIGLFELDFFCFVLSFGRFNIYFPVVQGKKEKRKEKRRGGEGRGEENRRGKGRRGEVRIYA